MKIPKTPMPEKAKIMKKMKKALEKKTEEDSKVDLSKLAAELSNRRERSFSEESK